MSSSPVSVLVDRRPSAPPLLSPAVSGDAATWAAQHRDDLRALVREEGRVLIRGLPLTEAAEAAAVFRALTEAWMAEGEPSAPRQSYGNGVYSSPPWPRTQPMCMHH